jgi:type IV pilus assembly protein PilY1
MSALNKLLRGLSFCLPVTLLAVLAIFFGGIKAQTGASVPTGAISTQTMANFTSYPAGINTLASGVVQPLIMLVMSRDEQLFNKAYSDYTKLNATDAAPETTYTDSFTYNGYFDPTLCYKYNATATSGDTAPSGSSAYFEAAAKVSVNAHGCTSGQSYWSGNFLNWLAMSRLDILRWAFYGGTRSTDTATTTVLERAEIPMDLHSWAKVYSGSDIANLTPFSSTTTFCNTSMGTTGSWTMPTTTTSGVGSVPVIRVSSGNWADWASTAKVQCQDTSNNSTTGGAVPAPSAITNYMVRVLVCQNASNIPNESFCVTDGSSLKPEGLLQKYSKGDSNQKRFGLVTGSVVNARQAGQVRRNVGMLAGNVSGTACATGTGQGDGDEFNSNDGTFCYKTMNAAPTEGIVYTLDHLQITGYIQADPDYGVSSSTTGCYGPNNPWGGRDYTIQATPTMCPDWGNPLAYMYATALQYIKGSAASNKDTSGYLPNPSWIDPYGTPNGSSTPRNQPCAACSVVVVSSGLNSFDYPQSTFATVTGMDVPGLTNQIQSAEGIAGQYQLSVYYNNTNLGSPSSPAPTNNTLTQPGTNYSDIAICAPATIGTLSSVTGICNGLPGEQGSYLIAGMSYGAWNASGTTAIRTTGVTAPFQVATYGVSLSDNLPSFSIPVGTGSISFSPSCRADPESLGTYAACYLGAVRIGAQQAYNTTTASGTNTYGLVPTSSYPNVGSYYFVWEDSQFGSDHDQDANDVISYCVSSSCNLPSTVTSGVAICDPEVDTAYSSNTNMPFTLPASASNICDSNGRLTFTPGTNDVIIRNQLVAYSSNGMSIGFEASGSNADGLYEFTFTNGGASSSVTQNGAYFNCNLLGNTGPNTVTTGSGRNKTTTTYPPCNSRPVLTHLTLGSTTPVPTLQSPLWYAAKYSNFIGTAPSVPSGQDPTNYFFARNAGALKAKLDAVFQSITSQPANNFGNATTPSSSNDIAGNGLSYQVQYYQQQNNVNWTGDLIALWSDSNGYQREGSPDSSGNEVLSSDADYVVSGPDTDKGAPPDATALYRCSIPPVPPAGSTTFDPSTVANSAYCSMVSTSKPLKPAWDAGTLLDAYYDGTTSSGSTVINAMSTQRPYSADASATANLGQRYIFTYITQTPDGSTGTGTVVGGTQTDFVWNAASCSASGAYTLSSTSGFCGSINTSTTPNTRTGNYGLLNEKSPALAQNLVNWVRGVEDTTDYRSRSINSTTVNSTYRLGDIVDSSPAIVGAPAESYDLLYNDYTYAAFRSNYANRRQMVYVGANDGMLHAFNGGFYVPGQAANGTTAATNPTLYRTLSGSGATANMKSGDPSSSSGNNWALGQEAWAFIPDNLLPHLRWLADKNYTHVFYVDGSPVVSDVQLWAPATQTSTCLAGSPKSTDIDKSGHVCGWGTVMVVPFRLGGGNIQVDTVGAGNAADTQTSNSAYVILDITDPEIPPTVLGEITTGTFTLGAPAFAVHREATDGQLHFLLTIGSGPADNGGSNGSTNEPVSAPAGQKLSVWVYDLMNFVKTTPSSTPVATFNTGPSNSFAGDMISSDFNLNYSSEGVYFGVVTNPPPASTPPAAAVPQIYGGGLWKVNMNTGTSPTLDTSDPSSWTLQEVINTGQPVTVRPTIATDPNGRDMVYFGTGRSYTVNDDSGATDQGTQQQYIYGVSDNSLLTGLSSVCQAEATTSSLYNAASTVLTYNSNGTTTVSKSGFKGVTTLAGLQTALATLVGGTGSDAECFQYSGWYLPLTAGNEASNTQQPSERVISSQTLFNGVLLTPTYIPPNAAQIASAGSSACDPFPVPGTSYLYGMNYLTGTADSTLVSSFGTNGAGAVSNRVTLGYGMASSPVLHVGGGNIMAAFGLAGGTTERSGGGGKSPIDGEISWREPVSNQ